MQLISPSISPPNHENIDTKTRPQHRGTTSPTLCEQWVGSLTSLGFQIEFEFGNDSFWGEGNTGVPGEKTSRSKDENQQQTQPTYDAESGNRTWATLVGGALPDVSYPRTVRTQTIRSNTDDLYPDNLDVLNFRSQHIILFQTVRCSC